MSSIQSLPILVDAQASVGAVVIGRNEGERLKRCLHSLLGRFGTIVYVDSGSTDGSVALALSLGVTVVDLDLTIPFTAARARNAGFERVIALAPELQYVQFVDGDCEMNAQWPQAAIDYLQSHAEVALIAGRLRERFPSASIYNALCDMEWQAPVGESKHCGGIFMAVVADFVRVKGFDVSLICGEEPEMCSRIRAKGRLIWRLPDEMALHDANMMHFSQWWRRTLRTGFGYAQAASMTDQAGQSRGQRESRSAWLWAGVLPLLIVTIWCLGGNWALLGFLIYPVQVLRLSVRGRGDSAGNKILRAFFLVLGKFPELCGQFKFQFERVSGRQSRLIEHK